MNKKINIQPYMPLVIASGLGAMLGAAVCVFTANFEMLLGGMILIGFAAEFLRLLHQCLSRQSVCSLRCWDSQE